MVGLPRVPAASGRFGRPLSRRRSHKTMACSSCALVVQPSPLSFRADYLPPHLVQPGLWCLNPRFKPRPWHFRAVTVGKLFNVLVPRFSHLYIYTVGLIRYFRAEHISRDECACTAWHPGSLAVLSQPSETVTWGAGSGAGLPGVESQPCHSPALCPWGK